MTYQLQNRLGFKLSRLSRIMQSRLGADLAAHGLTRLKWCVLASVEMEHLNTPSELADNIGIARPAMSRLLKAMTKDGLIERRLNTEDGRARQIMVTARGKQKVATCWPLVQANQDHFLNKLSADQHDSLNEALRLMIRDEAGTFDDI
ncbi:MarR family transcriptional regulator [Ascidiaceihabitans sp.]|uniref:MarR family winged helix-turn-helix transcriptional regulator n=1 Tax=Ascidiaceihabitans sp. TaxID=1872644 RepID=UPI003297C162